MVNTKIITNKLMQLQKLGILIAVDDFGTGYSSMSYLKEFPINKLKIDRSFIAGLPQSAEDTAIVHAVITMAHGLNLKTIAEGVEEPQQSQFLLKHNCDIFQGYYYARPLPFQEILQLAQRLKNSKDSLPLEKTD